MEKSKSLLMIKYKFDSYKSRKIKERKLLSLQLKSLVDGFYLCNLMVKLYTFNVPF